jgi:hypothetical protein
MTDINFLTKRIEDFDKSRRRLDNLKKRIHDYKTNFRKKYADGYVHENTKKSLMQRGDITRIQNELKNTNTLNVYMQEYNTVRQLPEAPVGPNRQVIDDNKSLRYAMVNKYLKSRIDHFEKEIDNISAQKSNNDKLKEKLKRIRENLSEKKPLNDIQEIKKEYDDLLSKSVEIMRLIQQIPIVEGDDSANRDYDETLKKVTQYSDDLRYGSDIQKMGDDAMNEEKKLRTELALDIQAVDNNTKNVTELEEEIKKHVADLQKTEAEATMFINTTALRKKQESGKTKEQKLFEKAMKEDTLSDDTKKNISVALGTKNGSIAAESSVLRKQDGLNLHVFDLIDDKMRMPSTMHPYKARTNLELQLAVGAEFDYLKLKPVPVYKRGKNSSVCFGPTLDATTTSRQPDKEGKEQEETLLKGFAPAQMTDMQKLCYHLFHPYAYDMNALFVHSAGSGKSWLISLLASTMARGEYNIMLVIDPDITKEVYDAILHHCADFNVQNFLIGHKGTLSRRFVRADKTPDCMNGEIQTVEDEDKDDDDEDDDDEDGEDEDKNGKKKDKSKNQEEVKNITKAKYVASLQAALGVNWITTGDERKILDHGNAGALFSATDKAGTGGRSETHGFKEVAKRFTEVGREFEYKNPFKKIALFIDEAHQYVSGKNRKHYLSLLKKLRNGFKLNKDNPAQCPRVFLFSATPYPEHPVQLVNLLNLLVPEEHGWERPNEPRVWDDDEMAMNTRWLKKYTHAQSGRLTQEAIERFQKLTRGHVSYYNSETDRTLFASKNFSYVFEVDGEIGTEQSMDLAKRVDGLSLKDVGPPDAEDYNSIALSDNQTREIVQCLRDVQDGNSNNDDDDDDDDDENDNRRNKSKNKRNNSDKKKNARRSKTFKTVKCTGKNPMATVMQRMVIPAGIGKRPVTSLRHSAPVLFALVQNVTQINDLARKRRKQNANRHTEKQYIYVDDASDVMVEEIAKTLVSYSKEFTRINDASGTLKNPGTNGTGIITYYSNNAQMKTLYRFDSGDNSKRWLRPGMEGKCAVEIKELLRGIYNSEENKGGAIAPIFINSANYKAGMSLKDTLHIHLLPMLSKGDRYQAEMRPIRYCAHKRLRDLYDAKSGRWVINIYIYEPVWPDTEVGDEAAKEFEDLSPLEAARSVASANSPILATMAQLDKLVPTWAVDRALTKNYHQSIQQMYDFNSVADIKTGADFRDIPLDSAILTMKGDTARVPRRPQQGVAKKTNKEEREESEEKEEEQANRDVEIHEKYKQDQLTEDMNNAMRNADKIKEDNRNNEDIEDTIMEEEVIRNEEDSQAQFTNNVDQKSVNKRRRTDN